MRAIEYTLGALLIVALAGLSNSAAQAGCCKLCGCAKNVNAICRKVCETEKVEVVIWSSECEDFCVGGKPDGGLLGCMLDGKCGRRGRCGCAKCGGCTGGCTSTVLGACGGTQCGCGPDSSCGKVLSRKKLRRRTVEHEVPVVKWVVESLCDGCAASCGPCVDHEPMPEAPEEGEGDDAPGPTDPTASYRHTDKPHAMAATAASARSLTPHQARMSLPGIHPAGFHMPLTPTSTAEKAGKQSNQPKNVNWKGRLFE